MNPDRLAACIDTSHEPAELLEASRRDFDEDGVRLRYSEYPTIYGKEADALMQRGYCISCIREAVDPYMDGSRPEDGEIDIFLSPVVQAVDTVEVTQARVEFADS